MQFQLPDMSTAKFQRTVQIITLHMAGSEKCYEDIKGKFVPIHVIKTYSESRSKCLLLPNLGTKWRRAANFTLRLLYPQERNTAICWVGGWVGNRSGLDVLYKRKISCPRWDSSLGPPSQWRSHLNPYKFGWNRLKTETERNIVFCMSVRTQRTASRRWKMRSACKQSWKWNYVPN